MFQYEYVITYNKVTWHAVCILLPTSTPPYSFTCEHFFQIHLF